MKPIEFVKTHHKPFIGDIDENVVEENGLNYYDILLLHCKCDYICEDCWNKLKKLKSYVIEDEWLDELECDICKYSTSKLMNTSFIMLCKDAKCYVKDIDYYEVIDKILDLLDTNCIYTTVINNLLDDEDKRCISNVYYKLEKMTSISIQENCNGYYLVRLIIDELDLYTINQLIRYYGNNYDIMNLLSSKETFINKKNEVNLSPMLAGIVYHCPIRKRKKY